MSAIASQITSVSIVRSTVPFSPFLGMSPWPYFTTVWYFILPWWRHQMETFPRYWPFVRGIHRSPVNSLHKGQWRGVLMFSLIYTWTNSWAANNGDADSLRRPRVHYDVTVMTSLSFCQSSRLHMVFTVCIFRINIYRKNGHHFAGYIFNIIFLYEDCCIFIKISMTFVPDGSIAKILSQYSFR